MIPSLSFSSAGASNPKRRTHILPKLVRAAAIITFCGGLAGCAKPLPASSWAGTRPVFDPLAFWTGHKHSWGVVERPDGAPSDTIETDCQGVADSAGGLVLHQVLTEGDGTVTRRNWRLRRTGPGAYEATADDMDGAARGTVSGRAFHWVWYWKRSPVDLRMSQWMYAMEDGTMINRTVISALGITVAEVTERFAPAP